MNKRFDFSQLGGFPFTQDVLAFMQESYRNSFASIAKLCGDKTILDGVVVDGGNVSSGMISYNGELIPFIAGSVSAGVVVEETQESLLFEDDVNRPVKFTKVAYCGSPATFNFSELTRLNSLKEMWLPKDVKEIDCTDDYIVANFDGTGLGINERKGWAICNGLNGTRDRRGLFPVGWDNRIVDPSNGWWDALYNSMGATGGEKEHELTTSELPPHSHPINGDGTDPTGQGAVVVGSPDGTPEVGGNTGNAGGGDAHENRPPFIVTLFIQKL